MPYITHIPHITGSLQRISGRVREDPRTRDAMPTRCPPGRPLAFRTRAHVQTRGPDIETIAAIRVHWAARHQDEGELAEDGIATERKGRLAATTKVAIIPETRKSPAWFICRACPEGGQRYRTDVGADALDPPIRHLTAIRRHFSHRARHQEPAGRADLPRR